MLFDILHGSVSPDALPPFWNILGNSKAWARITAKFRMFGEIITQTKEEKGNCDIQFKVYRAVESVLSSVIISNTLFKKNSTWV